MSDKIERKDIEPAKIDWNEQASYWNDFEEAHDYTQQTSTLLSNHINLDGAIVLDFGCGTGLLTDYMQTKAKQIVAVDTSEKMIEVLNNKNYNNVTTIIDELTQKSVDAYPTLMTKFDLVVASSVCAFVPNLEEVLTTIKSLLKPNGIFVQWDWLQNEREQGFGFTEKMIRDLYQKAGLQVESVSIPFYMMENDEKMEVIMAIGKP